MLYVCLLVFFMFRLFLYFVSSALVAQNKDYNFIFLCANFLVFHNQKNEPQLYKRMQAFILDR